MNTFENLFLNNKITEKYSNGVISLIEDDYHDNFLAFSGTNLISLVRFI